MHSPMHSSQINTFGPATMQATASGPLPQKEQYASSDFVRVECQTSSRIHRDKIVTLPALCDGNRCGCSPFLRSIGRRRCACPSGG